jgi:hypothetical protein
MHFIDELKPIEQIESGIKKLLAIDSSDENAYEEMNNIILNYLHPIPFPVVDLIPGENDFRLHRALLNDKNETFTNISRISSHHNFERVTKFGRCNTPGQSTFYSADKRATATLETLNKETLDNSRFLRLTVGRWILNKPLKMAILIYSEDAMKKNSLIKERYDEFQFFLQKTYPNEKPIIDRILHFFSDYFSRPLNESNYNEYKISAAFYNYILKYCDGVIYPSVKISYDGLNYAFPHQKYIDQYVMIDRVMMGLFKKAPDGNFFEIEDTEDRGLMIESDYIRWNDDSVQKLFR